MPTLRTLTEPDIPAVATLFGRVYPEHRWSSRAACEAYFHETLFGNPWRELELPSWIAEEGGRITGLCAVLPRAMRLAERPIRVAVNCQFMVDPDQRHGITALQLMKACISGPQDLTLADGATDQARRMWTALGGNASLLYSLHWTRLVRPVRYLLSRRNGAASPALALATRPFSAVADALAARLPPNRFFGEAVELVETTLDPATMLDHMSEALRSYALRPTYDAGSLSWLLEQAARKTRHGALRARAVRNGAGRLVGWYLYYLNAGGASEVVQLVAINGFYDSVLRRLLVDAWRGGAAAVRGRFDPPYAQELADRHCWSRTDGTWTLVHSRAPDIMAAVHQGTAFLSRLEGEWWLRFLGEEEAPLGADRNRDDTVRYTRFTSSATTELNG
jgi:hypothetical protein